MTATDVETQNIELVRKGFEAFAAVNMAVLGELFDYEANWHASAAGVLRGDCHGRDAIFAMFAQLHQETGGTFASKPVAFSAVGEKVFVQTEVTGERKGYKLNASEVVVFTLAQGRVKDVRVYHANYPAVLSFWA